MHFPDFWPLWASKPRLLSPSQIHLFPILLLQCKWPQLKVSESTFFHIFSPSFLFSQLDFSCQRLLGPGHCPGDACLGLEVWVMATPGCAWINSGYTAQSVAGQLNWLFGQHSSIWPRLLPSKGRKWHELQSELCMLLVPWVPTIY